MNTKETLTINISASAVFKTLLILGLFALLYFLRDLVLVLLTSVVIASSIEPLIKWCVNRHIPRVISVIMLYVLFFGIIVGLLFFFLPPLVNEASVFLVQVPKLVGLVENWDPLGGNLISGEQIVEGISEKLPEGILSAKNSLAQISGSVFKSFDALFGGIFSFILIIVLSFYLSVQKDGIESFLRLVAPVQHEAYLINLWERARAKIGQWMQGQLLLAFLIGIFVFLGLTVMGIKYALVLAVLASVFELIPLFGPILAAAPGVALGFLQSFSLGLMVLGFYILIQQFENHLLYPLVVRKVVGVSPILVIVALVVGANLAGFLGILLAVPVASTLMIFAEDIQKGKSLRAQKVN